LGLLVPCFCAGPIPFWVGRGYIGKKTAPWSHSAWAFIYRLVFAYHVSRMEGLFPLSPGRREG